jgi:hypothetical protein
VTAKHRFLKFWPQDWQRDAALRLCSLAARGLWLELLALAHDAEPYGHVTVNGRPPTQKQLAVLVNASTREVGTLIGELESAGVFSRTPENVIFSRRMVKDHDVSLKGEASVRKRWGMHKDRNSGAEPNRVPNSLESESESESEKPQRPPRFL